MSNFLEFAKQTSQEQIDIIEERNKVYGNNFEQFGSVIAELFPKGIDLKTPQDWNRLGIIVQIVSKLTRYAQNFNKGGHRDSLQDLSNYSMILQYMDYQINSNIQDPFEQDSDFNKEDHFHKNLASVCEKEYADWKLVMSSVNKKEDESRFKIEIWMEKLNK